MNWESTWLAAVAGAYTIAYTAWVTHRIIRHLRRSP